MSFNPSPKTFFGPSYSITSGVIHLPTSSNTTGITVSGVFTGGSYLGSTQLLGVLIFSLNHNLKIGDRVRLVKVTGDLPTPLAENTDYWVTTTTEVLLTLSATKGGSNVVITAAGGSDHIMKAMDVLPEITATEANADTGDSRKVSYGIIEMMYQRSIAVPVEDRPEKVTMSRSSSTDDLTGLITRNYSFSFVVEPIGIEVANE